MAATVVTAPGLRPVELDLEQPTTRPETSGSITSDSMHRAQAPYIETGHRITGPSVTGCLNSLVYLHRETVNIYSHALGVPIFITLPVRVFATGRPPRVADAADLIVCCIYFCCAAISFLLSAISHMVLSQSETVPVLATRIHCLALIMLLWGANVPIIYYAFHYNITLQVIYWTLTSSIALVCSAFSLCMSGFTGLRLQGFKITAFASLTTSMLAPIVHGFVAYGLAVQVPRLGLQWLIYALIILTVGFAAHVLEFTFEIFVSSHEIMHVMLLVASIVYVIGLTEQIDYVHDREIRTPG